jgi:uncharacterized membrane protein YfcA
MPIDPAFYAVGLTAVLIMSLAKGAFGGGLAVLGVPMLALVVDPITATIMMAPIVSAMDPFGMWAYPPRTWSWPDLSWLMPGIFVGLGIGALFVAFVDPRLVALAIAAVTLWFTGRWLLHDRKIVSDNAPVNPGKALVCAALSGFATFIAHGGNPPIAWYLLPRGLSKTVYAGTMIALFLFSNTVKLGLYFWLTAHNPRTLLMAAVLMPAIPVGVWLGKRLHDRLDEKRLYLFFYLLLAVTGLKLLIDSLRALLA